ncbi:KxYKxGKxW signal peptide domain-containing protein [Streptomyces sp. NBC_00572]
MVSSKSGNSWVASSITAVALSTASRAS